METELVSFPCTFCIVIIILHFEIRESALYSRIVQQLVILKKA